MTVGLEAYINFLILQSSVASISHFLSNPALRKKGSGWFEKPEEVDAEVSE